MHRCILFQRKAVDKKSKTERKTPAKANARKGKQNKEVEYLVTETGLTVVVCAPHQAMGMVALIVVGNDLSNATQVLDARVRGKGKDKVKALIEQAKANP